MLMFEFEPNSYVVVDLENVQPRDFRCLRLSKQCKLVENPLDFVIPCHKEDWLCCALPLHMTIHRAFHIGRVKEKLGETDHDVILEEDIWGLSKQIFLLVNQKVYGSMHSSL